MIRYTLKHNSKNYCTICPSILRIFRTSNSLSAIYDQALMDYNEYYYCTDELGFLSSNIDDNDYKCNVNLSDKAKLRIYKYYNYTDYRIKKYKYRNIKYNFRLYKQLNGLINELKTTRSLFYSIMRYRRNDSGKKTIYT